MLLPTEGRGRNGNRNHRRRCLTEPSAPLTEGKREAARARQSLTARDRARAGSRARDPEQRRPHPAKRGRGRVGRGAARGGGLERRQPGYSRLPEITRARAGAALTASAGGETSASASVPARMGARAPSASQASGRKARMRWPLPLTATPASARASPRPLLAAPVDSVAAASDCRAEPRATAGPGDF